MLDPSDLYTFTGDSQPTDETAGPMIVALGGFVDAGYAQRLLCAHLLESASPEVLASFDTDQLIDYRGNRPHMVFDRDKFTAYDDPKITLFRLTDRDGRTFYLLNGPEPDYQWERVIAAIRQLADRLGVTLVVTAHGVPMGVPHTRPIGVTAHSPDSSMTARQRSPFGKVQVPASLNGLLEYRLGEEGRKVVGLSVHVPAYVAQLKYPDGALAALNAINDLAGLNLSNDALAAAAGPSRVEIDRQVAENGEIGPLITSMEQQYDEHVLGTGQRSLTAAGSDMPSADELGAEFEEYLRTLDDQSDT